ncbi:hypothetical protein PIB30_062231 [Stylosanthes scabra]|uniref:Uncharacterized protein n=1 Tax=Stylosanthes scabra TaxID=79078 RepID=A0ABU6TMR8_9FABA|nr:hypothetical protein [Stylosanthes scabra]
MGQEEEDDVNKVAMVDLGIRVNKCSDLWVERHALSSEIDHHFHALQARVSNLESSSSLPSTQNPVSDQREHKYKFPAFSVLQKWRQRLRLVGVRVWPRHRHGGTVPLCLSPSFVFENSDQGSDDGSF